MVEPQARPAQVGYRRDASWWPNPDTGAPKRIHRDRGDGFAACSSRIMLNTDTPTVVAEVAPSALCRRCFGATSHREEQG